MLCFIAYLCIKRLLNFFLAVILVLVGESREHHPTVHTLHFHKMHVFSSCNPPSPTPSSALRHLYPMQDRRRQVPGEERLQGGVHALLGLLPRALPPLAQGARHRAGVPRPARPAPAQRHRGRGPQHEQLRLQWLVVAVILRLQWPPWGRRAGQIQIGIVGGAGEEEGQVAAVPAPEEGQLQGRARRENKP